jgi:hypothetical protein
MIPIVLHHNPANGRLPGILALLHPTSEPLPCGRCGRCNRDHDVHVWQVVDRDMAEQGGVIDCGVITCAA